jgi:hypothetical protein
MRISGTVEQTIMSLHSIDDAAARAAGKCSSGLQVVPFFEKFDLS